MPPFPNDLPYQTSREPVYAANCVATSQPLAAQAGLEMLRLGGNAFDAAIAAAAALTVVEPTSNGIGSDAFAILWAGGGLHALNASGRSPALLTEDEAARRFAGKSRIPFYGWDGVTTPGCVSAWVEINDKFGALPLSRVLAPAIKYARDGFPLSPQTGSAWARAARGYAQGLESSPEFQPWFDTFAPNGQAPQVGELVRLPGHADTLQAIGESNGRAFYTGELAAKIAKASESGGGLLRRDDLAEHEPEWVRTVTANYLGWTVHEIPPNGQGIAACIGLELLERHRDSWKDLDPDDPKNLHLQIEAIKAAFADTSRYVADEKHMPFRPEQLLERSYLDRRAKEIDLSRAQAWDHGTPMGGGTVYLCASDAQGNMISFIQSNYTGFGSGMVVPGTGIALQNRGCCFTLDKTADGSPHPNRPGPRKLPYHTIIPGFVTQLDSKGNDQPVMAFGVMGGFMQPQGHLQVIHRLRAHQQNPQAALDAPRFRWDEANQTRIEPGFNPDVYEKLRAMGHELTESGSRNVSFGRGQIIWQLQPPTDDAPPVYVAASEQRADGQAVGF
ncbi:MAG: gamma-glutamyltransferase family protein [Planctomycetota bacterium]